MNSYWGCGEFIYMYLGGLEHMEVVHLHQGNNFGLKKQTETESRYSVLQTMIENINHQVLLCFSITMLILKVQGHGVIQIYDIV